MAAGLMPGPQQGGTLSKAGPSARPDPQQGGALSKAGLPSSRRRSLARGCCSQRPCRAALGFLDLTHLRPAADSLLQISKPCRVTCTGMGIKFHTASLLRSNWAAVGNQRNIKSLEARGHGFVLLLSSILKL